MQRYFARVYGKDALLTKDDAFHLTKVMRCRTGDKIEVVADDKVYLCEVKSAKPLQIAVKREIKENNELRCHVVLVAALLKGDHMDMVVQKATELGVEEVVFLSSERTIVKIKTSDQENKFERFRRIAKEAAEQSKRSFIPYIHRIIKIDGLKDIKANLKLIAYEGMQGTADNLAKKVSALKDGQRVAIVIGPEGGFTPEEINTANYYGFKKVGLGKRILRAETASMYALSVIANALEQ